MTDLTTMTLAEARDALKAKRVSAVDLTKAHLAAMEQARPLNAYVLETPDQALAMAKASDEKLARGEGGPLEGLPLGVKDLYATKGVRTTACSKILDGFVPPYESTVTSQLWRDGAVMLGKLNNDEFAMGSSNETSALGPVVSPWAPPNWGKDKLSSALKGDKKGLLVPGARRVVRPLQWRRICAWEQPRPIPADQSVSRRLSPARSASSRPMGGARAGALWLSRPRSIKQARLPARCATMRSCCGRWQGMIRKIRPALIVPYPITRPRWAVR